MSRRRSAVWQGLTCAVLLAVAASVAGNAGAAGLQVSPISVTLEVRESADGLWLSNTGDAPLHAQVRVFRWTQVDGEDQLEPTRDLVISPPMIELPVGGKQLIRVIRLGAPPTGNETSYRLIIDELPVKPAEPGRGLHFVLRYSLPVFVEPAGAAALAPQLQVRRVDDAIEVDNTGNQHAQLAGLHWIDADGQRHELAAGLLGYVLPGQTMRWPLTAPSGGFAAGGHFEARINSAPTAQSLLSARAR